MEVACGCGALYECDDFEERCPVCGYDGAIWRLETSAAFVRTLNEIANLPEV